MEWKQRGFLPEGIFSLVPCNIDLEVFRRCLEHPYSSYNHNEFEIEHIR